MVHGLSTARLRLALIAPLALLAAFWLGPAAAQSQMSGIGSSDAPIDITSDTLEVQQDKQLAIFTGNVRATQGDMLLNSSRLDVYYVGKNSDGTTGGGLGSGDVKRLEAYGDVFLSTTGETAQGDLGIYDLEKRVFILEGNVVLNQGDNVLRGQRMVWNLDTDRIVVDAAKSTGRGEATTEKQERVKVRIQPKKKTQ
ncbi:Lipopolysaccharide export system protein LptA precursor [Oceanibacterium hippocampi]|uniref:Lipopolysaccharide export system protein LptA n=2 Tax=Oceanibacterium hippocampi TaxID=745714 RepID=A0A1Y5RSD1_9PROT|nr:Lipopolysaccharide export system protein LptA precursor [Oceanibacterium hippocampi]